MKPRLKKVLSIILIILSIVGVYFLGFFTRELTYTKVERAVLSILDKYQKYYYFEQDSVVKDIANAILDEYSTYYSKEEYQEIEMDASGKSLGIGIMVNSKNLEIVEVIKNSPCFKAGVQSGGKLYKISVDGVDKPFTTYDEFSGIMSSVLKDNQLVLTVLYGNEQKSYSLKKARYQKSYVTYMDNQATYYFIENDNQVSFLALEELKLQGDDIGYIKYEQFSGKEEGLKGSYGQMQKALEKFKADGKKKLILDLRDNGGGYMDVLSNIAGLLVEPEGNKQVISIAKFKDDSEEKFYLKNSCYNDYGFEKIVVLANQNTASASEVLIGAMLDYDKSNKVTVILDGFETNDNLVYRTYGKGIMQTTFVNSDGSAVKLTTAKIFWPKTGTCIHDGGITTSVSSKIINADKYDAFATALKMLNE